MTRQEAIEAAIQYDETVQDLHFAMQSFKPVQREINALHNRACRLYNDLLATGWSIPELLKEANESND